MQNALLVSYNSYLFNTWTKEKEKTVLSFLNVPQEKLLMVKPLQLTLTEQLVNAKYLANASKRLISVSYEDENVLNAETLTHLVASQDGNL